MSAAFEPLALGAAVAVAPAPSPPRPLPEFLDPPPEPGPVVEDATEMLRREAFEAGRRAGLEEAALRREARMAETLEAIRRDLATAQAAAAAASEQALAELAQTLFAFADAALPGASRRAAAPMVAALTKALRDSVPLPPDATVFVAPSLVPLLSRELPLRVEGDLALPEGDARIAWRGGAATLDLAARRAALRDALSLVDLLEDNTP
jgi:hypothetical protein